MGDIKARTGWFCTRSRGSGMNESHTISNCVSSPPPRQTECKFVGAEDQKIEAGEEGKKKPGVCPSFVWMDSTGASRTEHEGRNNL